MNYFVPAKEKRPRERIDPDLHQNTESSVEWATAFSHRSRRGFIHYSSKRPTRPRYILLEKLKQFSSICHIAVKKPKTKKWNASKMWRDSLYLQRY